MKPNDTWNVLPHGDIQQLADNLYLVEGKLRMPFGESTRHMTIVCLAGNRLALYSPIALDDARMTQLLELGAPAFLIIPSGIHRLDARPWQRRFPAIHVVAPRGARDRIREVVDADLEVGTEPLDLGDPRVQLELVPGTDGRELSMLVATPTGKTLVVNDLIFNLPEVKGLAGLGMKLLGFHPGHAAMPKLVKMRLVAHEDEVRSQLQRWADLADLERLVVAHGAPIANPRETLRELAMA